MKKPKKNKKHYQLIAIDFATFQEGVAQGLELAAAYVEDFDKYVNHEWRLSDCIRAKFGRLRKSKVRRNKREHVIVGVWNK